MADILIVEDEDVVRHTLKRALMASGHEVREAIDGVEAMKAYRAQRPDLVICDMIMPKQDGTMTMHELRRRDEDLKIIAISGGGRTTPESLLGSAEKIGANRTLAKPFELDDLLNLVNELLGG